MRVKIPQLNAVQRKEIAEEAQKQINAIMPWVVENVEAIILWQLHEQCGYGVQRLKRFFDETAPMMNGILEYYNYKNDEDAIWVCKHKLKEIGIDLDEMCSPFRANVEVK